MAGAPETDPNASSTHPVHAHSKAEGGALAFGVFELSPLFIVAAFALVVSLSKLSLPMLWFRVQQGGIGMWVLPPVLVLGLGVTLTVGSLALLSNRVVVWPLLVVPTFTSVAGVVFEHSMVQRAFDAVAHAGVGGMTQLRVFAEGVGEAQNPKALGFFCAGLLLTMAAASVTGHAMKYAVDLKLSRVSVRALGSGLVGVLGCLAYAFGSSPQPLAVAVVVMGTAFAALSCAFVGATLHADPDADRVASAWLLQMAGFGVGAQLCFAGFWSALATHLAFGAIGGEAVPDELTASRLAEALEVASWCQSTLLGLALLPGVVVLVTLGPLLARRLSWSALGRNGHGALAVGLGAVSLGFAHAATQSQLDQCRAFHDDAIAHEHRFVTAMGGKPQRFYSDRRPVLWAGASALALRFEDDPQTNLPPTSKLLERACPLRLPNTQKVRPAPYIVVDERLSIGHVECLMVGSLGLEPDVEHVEDRFKRLREYETLTPRWILRAPQPALPTPFDALALRVVELEMGVAARPLLLHLELQATHWQLRIEQATLRLTGELSEQRAQLITALSGRSQDVSLAAAADIPAATVLNAALAIADADCQPQLWLSGYSQSWNDDAGR